ncbi:uncharacterized protein LOC124436319 [Xenia sp. Carnegie-2017]|uniref:uncharacterized protein LOC124436319 n=1 Tax=Xenia sp. Carnegie-2017 TaxID=2897299 RepID=UPI001F0340DF|nr:uncharacterized protein LOC124436319 [Xenia sp. Carnegie-2017]
MMAHNVVSQVCVICDVVLSSPLNGPLCKHCHTFIHRQGRNSERKVCIRHKEENPTISPQQGSIVQGTKIDDSLVKCLPTQILMHIFSYLDDEGLIKLSLVCQRWRMLTVKSINWKVHFETKWPIFCPHGVVTSWQDLFLKMLEASTCLPCLEESFNKLVKFFRKQ